MRLDRVFTIYVLNYLIRLRPPKKQIPILMYHSVSCLEKNYIHPYYIINTSPDIFYMHMSYLNRNNYNVINIDEALRIMNNDESLNNRYAVITFDDGYEDNLINALPILKEFNYKATVYLPTNFIGKSNRIFNDNKCLNWQEVIELQKNNIEIGSHTVTHPQLSALTYPEVETEIAYSKEVIEDNLGTPCNSFSYPYAFPEENKKIVKFLRKVLSKWGYHNSVSTRVGSMEKNADNYFIKRIPVNSYDDEQLFRAKLEGAYNWIHIPQLFFKHAKKISKLLRS